MTLSLFGTILLFTILSYAEIVWDLPTVLSIPNRSTVSDQPTADIVTNSLTF